MHDIGVSRYIQVERNKFEKIYLAQYSFRRNKS